MNQTGWNPPISQFIWVEILPLKMVAGWNPVFLNRSTSFTSSTFPIQPDFSQNQPAAITLNTGSPQTLIGRVAAGFTPIQYVVDIYDGVVVWVTLLRYTLNSVISTSCYVTHSRISRNSRERMFVVQISFLIVTYISFPYCHAVIGEIFGHNQLRS